MSQALSTSRITRDRLQPRPPRRLQTAHQVLELHVQVLLDGEAGVRDGFVEVRVQIRQHLEGSGEWADAEAPTGRGQSGQGDREWH